MNSEERKAVHRLLYAHYKIREGIRRVDDTLESVQISTNLFHVAEAIGVFHATPPFFITHFDFAPVKAESCVVITDWTDFGTCK